MKVTIFCLFSHSNSQRRHENAFRPSLGRNIQNEPLKDPENNPNEKHFAESDVTTLLLKPKIASPRLLPSNGPRFAVKGADPSAGCKYLVSFVMLFDMETWRPRRELVPQRDETCGGRDQMANKMLETKMRSFQNSLVFVTRVR